MRKIEQLEELAGIFREVHAVVVTAEELAELEHANWQHAQETRLTLSAQGAAGPIGLRADLGKAIGFIAGAVLGALFLPGLGIAAGWFAGAVIGGSIGYKLVGLFDSAPGRKTDTTTQDPIARFSGASGLVRLGTALPIIYGNRKINPDGGVIYRDPPTIYTRILSRQGLQYLEKLSVLSVGELGEVDKTLLQLNDQPIGDFGSDAIVETSSGRHDQAALGGVDHYSQAVSLSVNTFVGSKPAITTRYSGSTRGAVATVANRVGATGTTTVKKNAGTQSWDAGFTAQSVALPAGLGSYVFASGKGTWDTTNQDLRWAIGLSASSAAATDISTMGFAAEIYQGAWVVWANGEVVEGGEDAAIVNASTVEVRYYEAAPAKLGQVLINNKEYWRGEISLPATVVGDYAIYSDKLEISLPRVGAVPFIALAAGAAVTNTTTGELCPGLGTKFQVAAGVIKKLRPGQSYRDASGNKFVVATRDLTSNTIEVNPSLWLSDIPGTSSNFLGIGSGSRIYESYEALYTSSKPVTSIDLVMQAAVWARNSSNDLVNHAQAFKVEVDPGSGFVALRNFVVLSVVERTQSLTITITGLPRKIYKVRVSPLPAEKITNPIESLKDTNQLTKIATGVSIDGSPISLLAEVEELLPVATATAAMSFDSKPQTSSDRGAPIQLSHVNEIVNPYEEFPGIATVPPGNGDGLTGQYYASMGFEAVNLVLTRVDKKVDFTWASGGSSAILGGYTTFSIRWKGAVLADVSTTYTFYLLVDDGARLWIDGRKIIDAWREGAPTEYKGNIQLKAGRQYSVLLEFKQNSGPARIALSWSNPFRAKQVIPQSQLYSVLQAAEAAPPLQAPTYSGYTIGRTRYLASDRLQSAPAEAWDIPEGQIVRQHLATGTTLNYGSSNEVYFTEKIFAPNEVLTGDILQIPGKGRCVIGGVPDDQDGRAIVAYELNCDTETIQGSSVIIVDYYVWIYTLPGMSIVSINIPSNAVILGRLDNNQLVIADEWGLPVKALATGTAPAIYNKSLPKTSGEDVVIYRMGSSNYFPDLFVDRLINPVSGLGYLVDGDNFIDYPSIIKSRKFCIQNKFFFDGVVQEGGFEQWAIETAPSSLLFPTQLHGKFALIPMDDDKPSYLFNASNVDEYTEPGVPWAQQLTNTVLVKYQDNIGREKQLTIMTAAVFSGSEPERVKTIDTKGVTGKEQAIKVGQVGLKSLIYQSKVCQLKTDVACGFYAEPGQVIRTAYTAIKYGDKEASGFVLSAETPSNQRLTTVNTVTIDAIYRGFVYCAAPHKYSKGATLVISGSDDSSNNGSYSANIAPQDNKILAVPVTTVNYSGNGSLAVQRPAIDQVIQLSEAVEIDASSRITLTHAGSRFTENDREIQDLGGGRYKVIAIEELISFGDAFAIGTAVEQIKTWRISAIEPDVKNNTVTVNAVLWNSDILSPSGLVVVE